MRKIVNILILLFTSSILLSQNYRNVFPYYYDIKELDANYIHIPNNNYGFLSVTNAYYSNHCSWFRFGEETIVYEQGLFFIGKINNEIYLSEAKWGTLYSPGPILNKQPAIVSNPEDSVKYRVYKISKGDSANTNIDVKEWPLQWGAPVTDNLKIKLYADQMLWTIYNGLDSNSIVPIFSNRDDYPAFPIEVHQIAYAYSSSSNTNLDFLEDVIFFEYTVINKGDISIDSAYIGLWTDIDFYGENNFPAVDTTLQLGYCWSDYTPNNPSYDSTKIPAVGYIQLFGPSVSSIGDMATFKGENKNDHKNLRISAFWGFHDDSYADTSNYGPAYSRNTAWNIARGYDKLNRDIVDPFTNNKTTFRYSGDPVTNTGWLANEIKSSGGAGFYIFSGPFNLAPQDTQWVMYALIAACGTDNINSVVELRRRADELKKLDYSDLVKFSEIPRGENSDTTAPNNFKLMQNYPNPFNPATTIKYSIPNVGNESFRSLQLKVYDVLGREVAILVNKQQQPGTYEVNFNGNGLPSGVYFYRIQSGDFTDSKKMILLR